MGGVIAGGQLLLCYLQCVLQELDLQGRLLALLLQATRLTLPLKLLHMELKEFPGIEGSSRPQTQWQERGSVPAHILQA